MAVLTLASILIFIKFIAPQAARAFANPGGFWLALPLGVSYFAIRMIDLAYTAHAGTLRNLTPRDYLAFLFMPHTLPAGPILTYQDFLKSRIESYGLADFGAGAAHMTVGLTKKLLADAFLLPLIGTGMMSFADGGAGEAPLYVCAFLLLNTAYVYLDFSAYCDLAIGAGRAGGYRIPGNFDWPLLRGSLRRFWQHWHMTLTQWVMRRVYFPAFVSSRSVVLSMYGSMLAIGLWHAPTLSRAMWAAHHTAALSTEAKLFPAQPPGARRPVANRWRERLTYAGGLAFVWSWVSLGHSFTLFSAPEVALRCYWTALQLPLDLVRRIAAHV